MFFFFVLTSFAMMHAYLFIKLSQWLGRGAWQFFAVILFASMLSVWWFRHVPATTLPLQLYFLAGFTWLGFVILVCLWLGLFDLIACFLLVRAAWKKAFFWQMLPWRKKKATQASTYPRSIGEGSKKRHGFFLTPHKAVPVALLFGLLSGLYALWEAQHIRPYYLTLTTDKLPSGSTRRLAVVSDVHLDAWTGPKTLRKIAAICDEARPDIFISLGDLVDTSMRDRQEDVEILRSIRAPLGKFGVLGNHEYYGDLADAINFHTEAGITLLRNTTVSVGGLQLSGVDDPGRGKFRGKITGIAAALSAESNKRYSILLVHRPKVFKRHLHLFDLQLSGHTHGGQIWPGAVLFYFKIHKISRHLNVLRNTLGKTTLLFITNGAGYYGPAMRFLTPPEVVIIDLINPK